MKLFKIKNLSITQKFLAGSLLLIIFLVLNVVSSIFLLRENREVVSYSLRVISPSLEDIKELQDIIQKSRIYTIQWINNTTQTEDDKDALRELHTFDFPRVKDELSILKKKWQNDASVREIDSIIILYDVVLQAQEAIMTGLLATGKDYENPQKVAEAKKIMLSVIDPQTKRLLARLKKISDHKVSEKATYALELEGKFRQLELIFLTVGVLLCISGFFASWYVYRYVSTPINRVSLLLKELSYGIIPKRISEAKSRDEIGTITDAVNKLIDGFKETSKFAENIGKGNFEHEFSPLSKDDILGNSLIEMRNNLVKIAEEEKKRAWVAEGLAKFADILRTNQNDLYAFSDLVIGNLVNYLGANQGGIFIVTENDFDEHLQLELMGCYAWGRNKFIEKKIDYGQGLLGQAWQSNEMIYLTDIPEQFAKITSGLGESNPTAVLIVPVSANGVVFGVMELYFFNPLEDYKADFTYKIAESMAITLASVKTNQRTQELLHESQELTDQMRAQEEEMRQNMEELQATQETAERKTFEAEARLAAINNSVAMIETNDEGLITSVNSRYLELLGMREEDVFNKPFSAVFKRKGENALPLSKLWELIIAGEVVENNFEFESKSGRIFAVRATFYPVVDGYGRLEKVIHIAVDISKQIEQAAQLARSNDEMQTLISQFSEQDTLMKDALAEMQDSQVTAESKIANCERENKYLKMQIEQFEAENQGLEVSNRLQNDLIEQMKAQEAMITALIADIETEKDIYKKQIENLSNDRDAFAAELLKYRPLE
jgi:PAS domain S-box-containing protein